MTLNEFKEKYNCDIDALEIKRYLPIKEKCATVNTLLKKLYEEEEKNCFMIVRNSVSEELTYTIEGILHYTNLEISTLDDYDFLKETGLMEEIISAIGADFKEYVRIFLMKADDHAKKINSVDGVVNRIIKVLAGSEELQELLSLLEKM